MSINEFSRRTVLASIATFALAPTAFANDDHVVQVVKSPTCGCCGAWVEHMRRAGFKVDVTDVDQDVLEGTKTRLGILPQHSSCHTARVGGYFVEGHVPASDIKRLLDERPDGLGLAVPGMPVGSPGMEMGGQRDPFEVLLIGTDGRATVFQAHR